MMILRMMMLIAILAFMEMSTMSLALQGLQRVFSNDMAFVINTLLLASLSLWGLMRLRRQGASAVEALRNAGRSATPPSDTFGEQLLMFSGAILLMIPGYLSGLCGASLLIPQMRGFYKKRFAKFIRNRQQTEGGSYRVVFRQQRRQAADTTMQRDDVIDIQAEDKGSDPEAPEDKNSKLP